MGDQGIIRDLESLVEQRAPLENSDLLQKTIVNRADNLEDRSRRNKLQFEGIAEDRGENGNRLLLRYKRCTIALRSPFR